MSDRLSGHGFALASLALWCCPLPGGIAGLVALTPQRPANTPVKNHLNKSIDINFLSSEVSKLYENKLKRATSDCLGGVSGEWGGVPLTTGPGSRILV